MFRVLVVAALVAASLFVAPPARALFHLIKISEIYSGSSAQPTAQFIELQMYADNQRFLASHQVVVFDASGVEKARYTFTSAVANGNSQANVLLATAEAETAFGVTADLRMEPVLTGNGGRVCFQSNSGDLIDCASWGTYSGDDADSGTPFNAPIGIVAGQSMERKIGGGTNQSRLDAEDDTNNSANDFQLAQPSPTNNAGQGADVQKHSRTVGLRLRKRARLIASGRVSASGDYGPCERGVPVKLQRRVSGTWRTLRSATTDAAGRYRIAVRDRRGRYRTKAPGLTPSEGHRCARALSPVRTR